MQSFLLPQLTNLVIEERAERHAQVAQLSQDDLSPRRGHVPMSFRPAARRLRGLLGLTALTAVAAGGTAALPPSSDARATPRPANTRPIHPGLSTARPDQITRHGFEIHSRLVVRHR